MAVGSPQGGEVELFTASLAPLLRRAARAACKISRTDCAVAVLALPQPAGMPLLLSEQAGTGEPLPKSTVRVTLRALHEGAPLIVPDVARTWPALRRRSMSSEVRSLAGVPLPGGPGRGCLMVASGAQREFATADIRALELVARRTTGAIEQVRRVITLQRRRLARELHDTLGQTLTSLIFSLDELTAVVEGDAPQALAGVARARGLETLRQLRSLIEHWNGIAPRDHGNVGRISQLVQELSSSGVMVVFRDELGAAALPRQVSDCLLGVAQEALLNVRRHARASNVNVVLWLWPSVGTANLVVSDDGHGFVPENAPRPSWTGCGLSIMRERVQECGGTLTITTSPGAGTRVVARLPIPGR